jgi:hypothetical protein
MKPAELQGLRQRRGHQLGIPDEERWDSSTQASTPAAQGDTVTPLSEPGQPDCPLETVEGEGEKGDSRSNGQSYRILSEVTVRSVASLDSVVIGSLGSGTLANVVEVVELDNDNSTMARIDRPVTGWILLKSNIGEPLAERVRGDDDGHARTEEMPDDQEGKEGTLRCWICFGDDSLDNLISPCACKGTQQMVHNECLVQWLQIKVERRTAGGALRCDICKTPYEVARGKFTWKDIFKMVGCGIMMVMFVIYLCSIVCFKCYKLVWMKSSLGNNWAGTSMTGLLALYNMHRIGRQMFSGFRTFWSEMRVLNGKRVQTVQSRH